MAFVLVGRQLVVVVAGVSVDGSVVVVVVAGVSVDGLVVVMAGVSVGR